MSRHVLVTGGAGFIGSHLVDALIERGDHVEVIDNLDPQVHKGKPKHLNPKATYHFADVRGDDVVAKHLHDADSVVHFAAIVGVGQSMYQVTRYVDVNTRGTAQVLQALVDGDHGVKKLLVASSMSVYGEGAYECPTHGHVSPSLRPEPQLKARVWEVHCPICKEITKPVPTTEDKTLAPNSVYAITKRDQEELALSTGQAYGIPTVALRFFNVYGPRQSLDNPYTGVAAIFQSRIKNNRPPVVFEDGNQTRDFVSVKDITQACVLAIEKSGADYQAVNVGTSRSVSINKVGETLLTLYGSKIEPQVSNNFRVGDIRHCVADISLARRLLGFQPRVSFEDGMADLVEWGRMTESQDRFETAYDELRKKGLLEG